MFTLLDNMRKRGVPVVFVENPEAPLRTAHNRPRVERFHREFAAFAARHHCAYWDFNPELGLTEKDFPDEEHVGTFRGRRALSRSGSSPSSAPSSAIVSAQAPRREDPRTPATPPTSSTTITATTRPDEDEE